MLATGKCALILCPTKISGIFSMNSGLMVIAKKEERELVRTRINTTRTAQFGDSVVGPRIK